MIKQKYKIYFSGSISGGRQDAELYRQIIRHLRQYGRVLTEHIGDPDLTASGEQSVQDSDVFRRDMKWINQADIFVAEVSTPSIGVGYEIAHAEHRNKPVLCLYRRGATRRLSAMIAGNPFVTVARYSGIGDLQDVIDGFFREL